MTKVEDSDSVAARVVDRLTVASQTVAVAEGATGGRLAALLTSPPGASDAFERGYVPYSYDALRNQLGIEREHLDRHGAVSDPVARSLARRARDMADATWGVSTVGIAGPSGGNDPPVGTVIGGLAVAGEWGSEDSSVDVERRVFDGDRAAVRRQAARWMCTRLHAALSDQ